METKDIILKEVMEELIITKEDFKSQFNGRKNNK